MRLGKKGHRKKPSQGYRSPKLVRGLHKTGLKLVRVCSLKELEAVPKDAGVIVSSSIGQKKRLEIIKRAEQRKINIINIKVDEFLKRVEKKKAEKKEEKKEEKLEKRVEKKKEEKEEVKKEKKIEEKEEKELTDQERKETKKKEKDRLLTRRMR
jgi:large subunit ribosomal protein L32e